MSDHKPHLELHERIAACVEQVEQSPYSHTVAAGWYAEDVPGLIEQLQAADTALKHSELFREGLVEQLEAANARKAELWQRLLDMEGKYLDTHERLEKLASWYGHDLDAALGSNPASGTMDDIRVLVDPCVGDWIPGCELCGEDIASWDDLVMLPFSTIGSDDEPDRILPCHRNCEASNPASVPHDHIWSLPNNTDVFVCMTCGVETTDISPGTSPESPCSICGTYGHFTHNHERETSNQDSEPSS